MTLRSTWRRRRAGARIATAAAAPVAILAWASGCGDHGAERVEAAARNARHTAYRDRLADLDPIRCGGRGSSAFAVCINVWEALYQYDYLARPIEVVPCLAAALPVVDESGTLVTIALRDDVRFQDDACFASGRGRPLVAADVVHSWKRIADPHLGSAYWSDFAGLVEGLDDFRDAARTVAATAVDYDAPVVGLRALDDHTLQLRLTRRWPELRYVLAQLGTAVVPREAVEHYGAEFARHPVGTGPYRLASWRADVRLVLERNPTFRGEPYPDHGTAEDRARGLLDDAGRTMPFIDTLVFESVQASETTWLEFLRGDLDLHGVPGHGYQDIVPDGDRLARDLTDRGVVLDRYASVFSRWIGFDMTDALIAENLPLRRALSCALNRQEFNELFLSGRSDLPSGLVPPNLRGSSDARETPADQRYDPVRARELVREAEMLHGGPLPPIRMLMAGSSPVSRQIGQLFTRWLEDVGLELRVEFVEEGALTSALRERSVQMFFGFGFGAAYPDEVDLFRRFYGGNVGTALNPFGFADEEFDALFERAYSLPQGPERDELERRMEQRVLDRVPLALFLDYNWQFVHWDWLRDFKPNPFIGSSGAAKYQRIDTELRARRITAEVED